MHALRRVARAERTAQVLTDALQTNPENRTLLPRMAFTGFASRYRQPTLLEGFTDITTVHFRVSTHQPRGSRSVLINLKV
jgi:bifunctional polynucleotide phosphatase/kinase